jgi:tetratricopeptide (TPR) repeat protein
MGYVYYLYVENTAQPENVHRTQFSPVFQKSILIVAVIISSYLIIWQNIQPARSAYYMRQALNEADKQPYRYADFSALMRRSLSFNTAWDAEYIIEYTTFYKQLREQPDVDATTVLPDVKFIASVGERYLQHSHADAKFISQLSGIYELVYEYGKDESDLARAEALIQQAIALSPGRVFYYHILAQIYEFNGRDEQAIQTLEEARALNDSVGETYWSLGIMYSKLDRHEEAIASVREAVKRRVTIDNPDSILEIVPIFEQEKDYASALFLYRQLSDASKTNTDYYAKIAALYAVMGDDEQAIATAYQIINLNPATAAQVNAFIDEVRTGRYRSQ